MRLLFFVGAVAAFLPTVVWHGLGDSADSEGILAVLAAISNHTKAPAIAIDVGARQSSFFGNINEQLERVSVELQQNKLLRDGFNAIGFSQGGQFLRAYVERYNSPPVQSLMTWGSQHSGISEVPCSQESSAACKSTRALVRNGAFNSFVQNRIIPAQYYKGDPEVRDQYLEKSIFLADINNEKIIKNATYRKNLVSLKSLVLIQFKDDTTVIPKQSSLFEDVDATGKTVKMNETSYWHDLGLKTLAARNRLFSKVVEGRHMEIDIPELLQFVDLYFRDEQGEPLEQQLQMPMLDPDRTRR